MRLSAASLDRLVGVEEKRALRRQREDHHFWSLIMLAVTARHLSSGHLGGYKGGAFCLPPRVSDPLKASWQKQWLHLTGILNWECSMTLRGHSEEIEPADKTRKEVLNARVDLYMTAKKWDMAAAVAIIW